MSEPYLTPPKDPNDKRRWSISREVNGRWIYLVQDSYLNKAEDAEVILQALHIPVTQNNLDAYFPERGAAGRCPTLELMELCCVLDRTNPIHEQKRRNETGV